MERLFCFGFSYWKRWYIKPFLKTDINNKIYFCGSLQNALKKGLSYNSKIFIWGKKEFKDLEEYANNNNIKIYRVEDGFLRSISLGSDLTRPYSLVVDSRGIYFDPTQESDLEYILNSYEFDDELINRAKQITNYILNNKISKYNIYPDIKIKLNNFKDKDKIILVPGQVEDDASIIYGANGATNLELLKMVREANPKAYIIYKPHPDVLAGNRVGNIDDKIAKQYCDNIITKVSIDSILELVNEVHTLTSLVGFEALLRGKKVYTYGMPFYAGWGLTIDKYSCKRRKAKRTIMELVAAVYILYPLYINPKTKKLCSVETVIKYLIYQKNGYNSLLKKILNFRNNISRLIQKIIRFLLRRMQ